MLRTLHIRDFVIVDEAEIHFQPGFTVFSGETGAGKSILIDALSLTLGSRADTGVIRSGAERADISAIFEVPAELADWLQERELDPDDGLILRRTIDRQGRSRGFINGLPSTLTQLRELGEQLIDIHGQHAHQSLLRAAHQRDLLDTQGHHQDLARAVRSAWQDWQAARTALHNAREQADMREQESDRLQWQLADLDRLDLREDEWPDLVQEHNRLAHAQALLDSAGQALSALEADDTGTRRQLSQALGRLQAVVHHDARLEDIISGLDSALIAVDEAISDLNAYLSSVELDPDALARVEQRMSAIFDLGRKLRTEPEALPALRTDLRQRLDALDEAGDLAALTERVNQAKQHYQETAQALSAARRQTGQRLARQVSEAMQALAMEGGRFDIEFAECEPSSHGNETVEFLVAGHAGEPVRPLARVASGGELARLSLALSVIASQAARVPTLIFDEVDSGIGGGVAEVVGRLLRELGQRHQVLCVTHLPQVAACATHHYQVSKQTRDAATLSRIQPLDQTLRVEEIARMLGGLKITETTRRHAREMLQTR